MLKRFLGGVLALIMAVSFAAVSASAEYAKGDVDGSGNIDIEDVANLMNHINGVKALSGDSLDAADINSDSSVDIEDVVKMMNTINGVAPDVRTSSSGTLISFKTNNNWKVYSVDTDYDGFLINYIGGELSDDENYQCLITTITDSVPGVDVDKLKEMGDLKVNEALESSAAYIYSKVSEQKTTFNGYDAYSYKLYAKGVSDSFDVDLFFVKDNSDHVLEIIVFSNTEYSSALQGETQAVLDSIRFK